MISASFFACLLPSVLEEEKKNYLLLIVIINNTLQTVILKYSALELSHKQKQNKEIVIEFYFQKEAFLIPFVSASLQLRNKKQQTFLPSPMGF